MRPVDRLLGRDRNVPTSPYAVRPFGTTPSDAAAADQAAAASSKSSTAPNLTTGGTTRTVNGTVLSQGTNQ